MPGRVGSSNLTLPRGVQAATPQQVYQEMAALPSTANSTSTGGLLESANLPSTLPDKSSTSIGDDAEDDQAGTTRVTKRGRIGCANEEANEETREKADEIQKLRAALAKAEEALQRATQGPQHPSQDEVAEQRPPVTLMAGTSPAARPFDDWYFATKSIEVSDNFN